MGIKELNTRWSPLIVAFLRIVIGGVFIFSGFVKAVDPWGSIYKFADYFNVFGFPGLEPFLLFMAVSLAVFEFMFGIFLFLGCYRRATPVLLLIMMAVMLPLTLYLAISGKVGDCGCFGDAIVLTNWETFFKNIPITLGLIYLYFYNKSLKNIYGVAVQWIVGLFTFVYILVIAFIGYFYQPLIDFRPFKAGTKIAASSPESEIDVQYIFIYQKDGVQKEFGLDSLPDETWDFVDRKPVISYKPHADSGISIFNGDTDITDNVLKDEGELLMLLFPDMKDVDISYTYTINEIYDYAQAHGIGVIGLTSGSPQEINEWIDLSMASYKMYSIDDSQLKQIARGNPAIVYVKDGVIGWKRTMQSLSMEQFRQDNPDFMKLISDVDNSKLFMSLNIAYLISMIMLLIVNRTHKVVKLRPFGRKKNQDKPEIETESQNKDVNLHP